MKTKVASLLVGLSLITTLCMAQDKITVEAQNNDISNNLDLKAVATAFGESRNLEEFEKKLNDYDSQISNLDLNNDGQVDYLRVVEKNENNIHVVEIQAVLDKDVYQDVASIVVEKDENNNPTVQVIGDPYLYGDNYIIEPAYAYTPSIFSFFWGVNYYRWNSPYYWGYYPTYYHHHRPYGIDEYYTNVYSHVNHNQRYYYTNSIRNDRAAMVINSIRRNDLGVRHPDQSFSNRNLNMRNKLDFEYKRNINNSRPSYQGTSTGSRPTRAFDNQGNRNQSYPNNTRPSNYNSNNNDNRNSSPRTYSTPSNVPQNSTINRDANRNYQSRQDYNQNVQTRSTNSGNSNPTPVTRDNNSYRPAPTVSQPSRENVQRPQVQRSSNMSTPRSAPAPKAESGSRSESKKESRSSDTNRR